MEDICMKKLGLIGGMGVESTIPYYHDIVYGVQKKLDKNIFPCLTIESVNIFQVLDFCREKNYDGLTEYLMQAVNNLIRSETDFIALSANTPHIVFAQLQEKSTVPLVSIIETTCNEAVRLNIKKVGLLGTIFTMAEEFYRLPFKRNDIEIITPNETDMEYINQKISSELEMGIVKKDTLKEFQRIIKQLKEENNIEAVILGCTELPLLLSDKVSPVPCLDTMKLYIDALINMIVE